MKMNEYLALSLIFVTGAVNASAAEPAWHHINLESKQGIATTVDFQIQRMNSGGGDASDQASLVWMNVAGTPSYPHPLVANDQVRVILNTYANGSQEVLYSQTVDLRFAGEGRFTGQAAQPLMLSYMNESGGEEYRTSLSLVVDGNWQTDPISGLNDFNLEMNGILPSWSLK